MEACRAGSSLHVEVNGLHVEVEQAKKKTPSPVLSAGRVECVSGVPSFSLETFSFPLDALYPFSSVT